MCSKKNGRFKSKWRNESKTLAKHVSCECKCKPGARKCN